MDNFNLRHDRGISPIPGRPFCPTHPRQTQFEKPVEWNKHQGQIEGIRSGGHAGRNNQKSNHSMPTVFDHNCSLQNPEPSQNHHHKRKLKGNVLKNQFYMDMNLFIGM